MSRASVVTHAFAVCIFGCALNMNADKITLQISGNAWIATHHGTREAELLDLFGTTSLPTCFTPQAPAEEVQREISRLNPDCIVEVL